MFGLLVLPRPNAVLSGCAAGGVLAFQAGMWAELMEKIQLKQCTQFLQILTCCNITQYLRRIYLNRFPCAAKGGPSGMALGCLGFAAFSAVIALSYKTDPTCNLLLTFMEPLQVIESVMDHWKTSIAKLPWQKEHIVSWLCFQSAQLLDWWNLWSGNFRNIHVHDGYILIFWFRPNIGISNPSRNQWEMSNEHRRQHWPVVFLNAAV